MLNVPVVTVTILCEQPKPYNTNWWVWSNLDKKLLTTASRFYIPYGDIFIFLKDIGFGINENGGEELSKREGSVKYRNTVLNWWNIYLYMHAGLHIYIEGNNGPSIW